MRLKGLSYLSLILLLGTILAGCSMSVYDDLTECPQEVSFTFYSQTPCQDVPTYPDAIKQVRVFAFDDQDILIGEYSDPKAILSKDYKLHTTFQKAGAYKFVAWGGSDLSAYDFSPFTIGSTTRKEMQLALLHKSQTLTSDPTPLYWAESSKTLKPITEISTEDQEITFNMQELVYRLHFNIISVGEKFNADEEFVITIQDNHDKYDFAAQILPSAPYTLQHTATHSADKELVADFTVMKLTADSDATVTVTNQTKNKVLYTAKLVKDLVLPVPGLNLLCEHDIPITLKFKNVNDTWELILANVLGWNVVKRDVNDIE